MIVEQVKRKGNSLLNFFEYLLLLALVVNANTIYVRLPANENNLVHFIVLFMMTIGVVGCLFCKNKVSVKRFDKGIGVTILFIIYGVIFILARPNNLVGDLHMMVACSVLLLFYFLYCSDNEIPSLFYKYRNVIFWIACVSIFMWLFCSVFRIFPATGEVYSSWSNTGEYKRVPNYLYIYFETQTTDSFGLNNIVRNTAIFTEAPMASLHFSLALLVELFFSKKISKTKAIVLIIAIITTFSMTGYLLVLMAVGIKILLYKPRHDSVRLAKYFLAPVGMVAVFSVGFLLVKSKLSSSSGSVRLDDFVAGYEVWRENILFGTGSGELHHEAVVSHMSSFRLNNTGFSNSTMMVLSERGLYGGILYLSCFVKGIYDAIKHKNLNKFLFTVLFLYLFAITVMASLYLTYFILIFLANHKSEQKIKYAVQSKQLSKTRSDQTAA